MRSRQPSSFVLRLTWTQDTGDIWYGEVEHVQTGRRTRIQQLSDFVHFVEAESRGSTVTEATSEGPELPDERRDLPEQT